MRSIGFMRFVSCIDWLALVCREQKLSIMFHVSIHYYFIGHCWLSDGIIIIIISLNIFECPSWHKTNSTWVAQSMVYSYFTIDFIRLIMRRIFWVVSMFASIKISIFPEDGTRSIETNKIRENVFWKLIFIVT